VIQAVDEMVEALSRKWGYGANVTRAGVIRMAVVRGLPEMKRTLLGDAAAAHNAEAAQAATEDQP